MPSMLFAYNGRHQFFCFWGDPPVSASVCMCEEPETAEVCRWCSKRCHQLQSYGSGGFPPIRHASACVQK